MGIIPAQLALVHRDYV